MCRLMASMVERGGDNIKIEEMLPGPAAMAAGPDGKYVSELFAQWISHNDA